MGLEVLLAAFVSIAVGAVGAISSPLINKLAERWPLLARYLPTANVRGKTKTYRERLDELHESLAKATQEVDAIVSEMTEVTLRRESAVAQLEKQVGVLESREQELTLRIENLKNVPMPVAEHFAQLTAQLTNEGEKKSALRDYRLFVAGVIVTTIMAIILKLIGWA